MAADDAALRLGKLDSCAVSDALDRLGLPGAVRGIVPLWPCPRIVGRAVTVKIKPAGLEKPQQHLCTSAIEAARPGEIAVVDNGGRVDVAAWGGLLSEPRPESPALCARRRAGHGAQPHHATVVQRGDRVRRRAGASR